MIRHREPGRTPAISRDTTLHRKILSDIEGKIVSGEWPPDHRLPFELDLAKHYACSRMTVNKVMTQLVQSGLIERRKKTGSIVAQPKAQSAILDIHDIKDEVLSLKLPYRFTVLSRDCRPADAEDARRLGLAEGAGVLDIACLHVAGTEPFCLEERLINLEAVPQAADFDFTLVAPGPFLLAQLPWTAARHRIHALTADKAVAKRLALRPDQACLVIERHTWGQDGPVTDVRLTYPGHRHVLTAQFKPGSG